MDGVTDQLLAGTRFAADQYGAVPLRNLPYLFEHPAHLLRVADDIVEAVIAAHFLPQPVTLDDKTLLLILHFP